MMKRSFLQKLQPFPGNAPSPDAEVKPKHSSEGLIREAVNLITLITRGQRISLPDADIPDVEQDTSLRLWKWLIKFRERSNGMSPDEWRSFTARSTYNEINRSRTKLSRIHEVPLEFVPEFEDKTQDAQSDLEMKELVREVWQGICKLSVYQRRALLLHSAETLIYLMQFGLNEKQIASALSFDIEMWRALSPQIPLTDVEIARLVNDNGGLVNNGAQVRNIKKARYDARKKLERLRK